MPRSTPPPLVKAHNSLDRAVDAAYIAAEKAAGRKAPKLATDADRVAFLFERYQALTAAHCKNEGQTKKSQSAAESEMMQPLHHRHLTEIHE